MKFMFICIYSSYSVSKEGCYVILLLFLFKLHNINVVSVCLNITGMSTEIYWRDNIVTQQALGGSRKLSQSFLTHQCYCLYFSHLPMQLIPSFSTLSMLQEACCHSLNSTEQHFFPAQPCSIEGHSFHSCMSKGVKTEAPRSEWNQRHHRSLQGWQDHKWQMTRSISSQEQILRLSAMFVW